WTATWTTRVPGYSRLPELDHRTVSVSGRDATVAGGWLQQAGMPTVVFGPGDKRLVHQPNEYVDLEDVVTFAKTVALFLLRWCGCREEHSGHEQTGCPTT